MSKIEDAVDSVRSAIDQNWSQRRRLVVAVGATVVSLVVLATGVWFMRANTPPKLPKTFDQAVAVMNSSKYRNLDSNRKQQYAEAAIELMRDLPEQERQDLFKNEDARQAIRAAFTQQMDDMARRLARGESLENLMSDRPSRRRGGPRPEGRRRAEGDTRDGQGDGSRAQRMAGRIGNAVQTGNAQRNALRGEMMQQMRAARDAARSPD